MENNYDHQINNQRGNFLYSTPLVIARPNSSTTTTTYGGRPASNTVKTEAKNFHRHPLPLPLPLLRGIPHGHEFSTDDDLKSNIVSHPRYSNLLQAYIDCQKIGAPPEIVEQLNAARRDFEVRRSSIAFAPTRNTIRDPELDQFMDVYCDMLDKYRQELTKPLQEAMDFMQRIETQLDMIGCGPLPISNSEYDKCEGGSSEENNNSDGETETVEIDPRAEDRQLKKHLLNKYRGYLSSLKQDLSKKKKKGKLPKEARQILLSWWELHYKWPYPSETEKMGLADSTGLDQKQINNWFINQRKRHWKPSDQEMQFVVMDGSLHHTQNAALYMPADAHNYLPDAHNYRLGP